MPDLPTTWSQNHQMISMIYRQCYRTFYHHPRLKILKQITLLGTRYSIFSIETILTELFIKYRIEISIHSINKLSDWKGNKKPPEMRPKRD